MMNVNFLRWLLPAVLLATGCTSFSTTPITRLENDAMSGDSNGWYRRFCRSRPYRGVPVKLKVQTHVDVTILEQFALKKDGQNRWSESPIKPKFYTVKADPVFSDTIVITDFKRPASGRLKLNVDYNEQQYFKKIDSELTDETIKNSAALLTTVLTKFADPTNELLAGEGQKAATLLWDTRTVAYQRFDINAADFEQQLDAFVSHHLNACNQCSGYPAYDTAAREAFSDNATLVSADYLNPNVD